METEVIAPSWRWLDRVIRQSCRYRGPASLLPGLFLMNANARSGYAAKATPDWQVADLPPQPRGVSRHGRAGPGIDAALQSGQPGFERIDPAPQNLLFIPRLGGHRPGRLELLATDQIHPGEDPFELVAETRLDLPAHPGQ